MKKIFFVVPLMLVLCSCGVREGLTLDSVNGDEFSYSIHYKAVPKDNIKAQSEKRLKVYVDTMGDILDKLKSKGFTYVDKDFFDSITSKKTNQLITLADIDVNATGLKAKVSKIKQDNTMSIDETMLMLIMAVVADNLLGQ